MTRAQKAAKALEEFVNYEPPAYEWDEEFYEDIMEAEAEVVQLCLDDGFVWQSPEGGFPGRHDNRLHEWDCLPHSGTPVLVRQKSEVYAAPITVPAPKPLPLAVLSSFAIELSNILAPVNISITSQVHHDDRIGYIVTFRASNGARIQYQLSEDGISIEDKHRAIAACHKLAESLKVDQ